MRIRPNVVKFRLAGFPLDALDQKPMRRLRRMSSILFAIDPEIDPRFFSRDCGIRMTL
jgi:hypothetical protein